MVVTIGKTVANRAKLNWWESRPLYGWTVLVPRTKDQAGEMSERLVSYGALPIEVPTIAVEPPRSPAQMERAVKGLVDGRFQWVVFTSTNAVRAVWEKFGEFGLDARAFSGVKIACVGEATADRVRAFGVSPSWCLRRTVLAGSARRISALRQRFRSGEPGAAAARRHRHRNAGRGSTRKRLGDRRCHRLPNRACGTAASGNPRDDQDRWFRRGVLYVELDGAQPGRHCGQTARADHRRLHRTQDGRDGCRVRPAGRCAARDRRGGPAGRRPGRARRPAARRGRTATAAQEEPQALTDGLSRHRPRRLRCTPAMRRLVAQTSLEPRHLVLPMFVADGIDEPRPVASMPGVVQHSRESLRRAAAEAVAAGVGGLMLFGVPRDEDKDAFGSAGTDPDGILNVALRDLAKDLGDATVLMADTCLDEFTDHGHCGVLDDRGRVDNDATLKRYVELAVAQANSGAHVVGPSGMMDGQVGAIRDGLDAAGHTDVVILAYAAKFASAFYGPFREAVSSSLSGDRRTYQQEPGNVREALREVRLDLDEGPTS
ncbi:uroporphyrinogen-III synthase HemD family protein [Mycobacterium xenopi 4042]|uniref:Delta-aminolevulinic acid dehydratase n=1 Tax=Mycobacterium xenopi 4042 TaxID=1299334 RepID=X8DK69_MYCXE|nr:uroporphyrinogen-III synthase HemD family protein [Mycobacterium xenopi 4042]